MFHDNYCVELRRVAAAGRPRGDEEPRTASDVDERELVAAVLRKDRKAAAVFVDRHIDAVYAYARHRLMPNVELADDVVQEVFLAAMGALSTFQGQSSLRSWLLGIARHKVEDVYRQRLRLPQAMEDAATAVGEPIADVALVDEQIDTARTRAKARRILVGMPEHYRLVLLWRYWEHRSTREIAAAIATTEKSIERMLARARAQFKERWMKEERDVR